jgi:hypothetical protein
MGTLLASDVAGLVGDVVGDSEGRLEVGNWKEPEVPGESRGVARCGGGASITLLAGMALFILKASEPAEQHEEEKTFC